MTISSAYEDFCARTLTPLSGVWTKLRYVAELRAPEGDYRHWGLARTFGDDASQRALAQAHSELFLEILRTPLRHLADGFSAPERPDWSSYLPAHLEGGAPEHFNSVVSALTALAAARPSSLHPAA